MRSTDRHPTRFEVTEPAGRVAFWILVLCVGLPVSVTTLALGMILAGVGSETGAAPVALTASGLALTVVAVLAIVVPLAILMRRIVRRLSVEIDGANLDVRAGWYRLSVALPDIDVAHARIVNLAEHTEYRPGFKTHAMDLPGFSAGHFRLRDWRRRAFVLLTARDRVLVLPLRDKRLLLLSLRHPQQLIDALHGVAR